MNRFHFFCKMIAKLSRLSLGLFLITNSSQMQQIGENQQHFIL